METLMFKDVQLILKMKIIFGNSDYALFRTQEIDVIIHFFFFNLINFYNDEGGYKHNFLPRIYKRGRWLKVIVVKFHKIIVRFVVSIINLTCKHIAENLMEIKSKRFCL